MKLVTFRSKPGDGGGGDCLGLLVGDRILDPLAALGRTASAAQAQIFADAIAFVASGAEGLVAARDVIAAAPAGAWRMIGDVHLRSPMRPSTILCAGSNYRAHNREKADSPTSGKEPEFFVKTSDCLVDPDGDIVHDPRLTHKLDCETELAVVIGKPGRHIPVERALDHVFGYTIVNDVTARDRQVRRTKEGVVWYDLGRAKAFDTSAPLGPCIVTADEIGDPQRLDLETRINGELRQSANTADMIWSCAQLIAVFSINFTLRPGMVIITGTPAGTAWSADAELGGRFEPRPGLVAATRYCEAGDVVESRIERIGVLRNHVVAAADAPQGLR
jgi:2-keto-4-pentenoate hydratase/2-oxohepta-3-ene-1,7-dioic acid hydratase in catechol pathway